METARQLEMQAVDRPEIRGVNRDELRWLADEFVALDLGEDLDEFLEWVQERGSGAEARLS